MELNVYAMNETAKRVMESIISTGKQQLENHIKQRYNEAHMPQVGVRLTHIWHDTTTPIRLEVMVLHVKVDTGQLETEAADLLDVSRATYHPTAEQIATLESAM